MDHASPIYIALVSQTEATIADQKRDIEMFRNGTMRIGSPGKDETTEWIARLEGWLMDNERLLKMLQDGTI